jgi:serine/threonine protein kinase
MKFGSFSVLLNENEYKSLGFKHNTNDLTTPLLKITYLKDGNMGDVIYGDFLNKKNDYVVKINKDSLIDLNSNNSLINYLKKGVDDYDEYKINKIFNNSLTNELNLKGYFLENLGDIDLFDSLTQLLQIENNIWIIDTHNRLNEFMKHMCEALEYLKTHNMCHFDIKPENIIYNNKTILIPFGKRFKLVDFGFADKYPFEVYSRKICGSIDYVPCYTVQKSTYNWMINNKPNDWIFNPVQKQYIHYIYRYNANPELIYKNDVYSMGVVFNQLLYYINCYMKGKHKSIINDNTMNSIIKNMTHKDITKRFYPSDCIKYLNGELDTTDSNFLCNTIFNCCKK